MGLFRFATLAMSIGLVIPSAQATTEPFTPPSLTDSHTLNLRAAGSRLVVDAIEDALRQKGLALFDEGFQLDSSLNWLFGENIEGEIDAVVPLWSGNGNAVFAQPGFVFWTGLADKERIDGNLGIAYRTGLTEDVIGGASVFYDRDFKQGHSRISLGADVQSGFFHGAANYYQPLSDEEDGREGFVEEALRGMDFRLAVQRDIMRASANLGYWRFEGEDAVEADWKISYGFDAGIRVLPGVFIEGGWEHHDEDVSIDNRWNAGLAFRFSLPNFKGASYGDGSMASNLHRIVEREKRILYEERVAGPSATIARAEGQSGNLREDNDNPASIQIRLSEALEEDVMLYLVGSGEATYGASGDYQVSVGDETCDAVTMGNCQITIPMGSTSIDVMITALEDGGGELAEEITLSIAIALAGNTGLMLGSPSSLTLTIDADPTAGFVLSSSTVEEPATGTIEHRIAVSLSASPAAAVALDAGFHLDGTAGPADDYNATDQQKRVVFAAGATGDDLVQEVVLIINADEEVEEDETIVLTLADSNDSLTSNGNNFTIENARHTVTIPANGQPEEPAALPTISFDAATKTAIEGDDATNAQTTATLSITPPPTSDVVIPYMVGGDGVENTDYLFSFRATSGSASVSAAGLAYPANATGVVFTITARDDTDRMSETVTITINDAAANFPAGYKIGDHRTATITLEDTTSTMSADGTIGFNPASTAFRLLEPDSNTRNGIVIWAISDSTALAAALSNDITLTHTISIAGDEDSDTTNDISVDPFVISASTGQASSVVSVDVLADDVAEGEEVATITLTDDNNVLPNGWSIDAANNTITVTIPENDQIASIGFSAPTAEIRETGGQSTTATVNIDRPNASEAMHVVLRFGTTDANPATVTLDYTWMLSSNVTRGNGGVVTIPAGTTSFAVTVTAIDDNSNEDNMETGTLLPDSDSRETVTLLLSESSSNPLPSGWELGTTEHRITILGPEI